MAKATKAATTKAPVGSAKVDKPPLPAKAEVPARAEGAAAAVNGGTAAAVSLKQMAATLAGPGEIDGGSDPASMPMKSTTSNSLYQFGAPSPWLCWGRSGTT